PVGRAHAAGLSCAIAGLLIASYAQGWDEPQVWASYHALAGAWSALAVAVMVGNSLRRQEGEYRLFPSISAQVWLSALAAVLVLLGVRGAGVAAAGHFTPMLAIASAGVLLSALAWWSRQGAYAYASGVVFALAGWLAAQVWGPSLGNSEVLPWAALWL